MLWLLVCSVSPANPACVSFTNVPPFWLSSSQWTFVFFGIQLESQVYARRRGGSYSRISPSILVAPNFCEDPEVDHFPPTRGSRLKSTKWWPSFCPHHCAAFFATVRASNTRSRGAE